MTEERREVKRLPDFRTVELVAADSEQRVFPLILRDSSGVGLGGLYVGKEPLDPEGDFLLREPGMGDREVRIVWARRVAEYVQLLGLVL